MKTTWISVFGTGLAALMLTGCSPSAADKAKDKVDQEKKDKINAVDANADAKKDQIKKEADLKKGVIDANAKVQEGARDQAAQNLENQADMKRKEADALDKKADEVKKD